MRTTTETPAPGFTLTKGRKPRTKDMKFVVQFRNGFIDHKHEYTADQLRWTDEGKAFDVVACRRAG